VKPLAGLAAPDAPALPLYAVRPEGLAAFLETQAPGHAAFLRSQNFTAKAGQLALLPGASGLAGAVLGLGADRSPFVFGSLPGALPAGTAWTILPGDFEQDDAALGFLLGAYAFDRFKPRARPPAQLAGEISPRCRALATAVCAARDLINTPANYLGPAELADAVLQTGAAFGAAAERVEGAALAARYPALAAVGAGSDRPAQVAILSWTGSAGANGPEISLCGKGVCFDTGGYDLKPSAAMLRMKKDMGGAAIMLGLARAIMALDLPVRLTLRVGCVENSVSGHAMRPSDILQTRAGLTVEVGNTDAEGRLVLCDLLAEAAAAKPAWLIDAATLTGAARVALGPDVPALFCNDDAMAAAILAAGVRTSDPLWRLPLFAAYDSWLESPVADLNNVTSKPFAGAIVAALFLQHFVPSDIPWAHVDTYAWNDSSRPGRPEGGEAQTLRALLAAIENFATT
jgi:leucyl aminopeptidase